MGVENLQLPRRRHCCLFGGIAAAIEHAFKDHERHLVAALKQARQRKDHKTVATLEAKINGPSIKDSQRFYVNAFLDLDTERTGTNAIPWSSIVRYGAFHRVNERQMEDLVEIVRRVDKHICAIRQKAMDKANGNAA